MTHYNAFSPETIKRPWRRVNHASRCPVCGKSKWCQVSPDGQLAHCTKVSAGAFKASKSGHWLHRLDGRTAPPPPHAEAPPKGKAELELLTRRFQTSVNPQRLFKLAAELGVSVDSLTALRTGWNDDRRVWCFPMSDASGGVVGIRYRTPAGRKFAEPGGREGLFLPSELDAADGLYVCEGASDTAALHTVGLAAVGRPSCTGGIPLLKQLVEQHTPRAVVFVADADEPGRNGATSAAWTLTPLCPDVRVIQPPDGVKDARAWVQAGAIGFDFIDAANATGKVPLRLAPRRIFTGSVL